MEELGNVTSMDEVTMKIKSWRMSQHLQGSKA